MQVQLHLIMIFKLFDGGKAILMRTVEDLVIQHNDANAFIQNTKGDIRLQTASNIIFDADGANILLKDGGGIWKIQ